MIKIDHNIKENEKYQFDISSQLLNFTLEGEKATEDLMLRLENHIKSQHILLLDNDKELKRSFVPIVFDSSFDKFKNNGQLEQEIFILEMKELPLILAR